MRRSRTIALAVAVLLACASPAWAEVAGKTTVEQTLLPVEGAFKLLAEGPGEPYTARTDGIGAAHPGRETRRRSLLYFGHLTDFQLADEESPARVEVFDVSGPPFDAAWRPQEALTPQTVDAAIRQVNAFAARSPLSDSTGAHARMGFALMTGDNADNQQQNETEWVVRLIEGGGLTPNSGIEPAPVYTGVSDYDDYAVPDTNFYDPDSPQGMWSAFPTYPGLLDRAQQTFQAAGLRVPLYATFGNHDALVQGNQAANASFEAIATGPVKIFGELPGPVPPDPNRQFVNKAEYKQLFGASGSANAHGFGLVDPAEESASAGAAAYYAFAPKPGVRFISVDTICEGGVAGASADGNVDDPQYRWLERQLKAATERDELVFLFSHHAIASLTCAVPDEAAGECGANPGCDLDPRESGPIHLGEDLTELVHGYPHVVAWVAGHTHANIIEPFRRSGGEGGFWSIRLASEIDWPQQSRLLEVMDNRDGTLSIFGTILDHAAPAGIPSSGTAAAGFDADTMAAISRTIAANDPQLGIGTGEGDKKDRNVELLLRDPRRNPLDPTSGRRRCASVAGRIRGRRLHRVSLGMKRAAVRRRYPSRTRRGRFDLFCLADGKQVRVKYRRGRVVLVLTSSPSFRARGIRVGAKRSALRGRAGRLNRRFYIARSRRATVVFRVARGRVREVGLAARRLTATRAAARRLLR
jgi:3',5'-cyclic AMP phosphodiesterase CpdA